MACRYGERSAKLKAGVAKMGAASAASALAARAVGLGGAEVGGGDGKGSAGVGEGIMVGAVVAVGEGLLAINRQANVPNKKSAAKRLYLMINGGFRMVSLIITKTVPDRNRLSQLTRPAACDSSPGVLKCPALSN
jgi:hypothetical protein